MAPEATDDEEFKLLTKEFFDDASWVRFVASYVLAVALYESEEPAVTPLTALCPTT